MTREPVDTRLALALAAGKAAAATTLRYFRDERLAVEQKADLSPVTAADRAAETLLRERISGNFPEDGILGEEFPAVPGQSGYTWILDPIDGTKSYIHGVPLYGTLIGLEFEGRCVLGVLLLPALQETLFATAGGGAWFQRGEDRAIPARVSAVADLSRGLLCTTSVAGFARAGRPGAFNRLNRAAGLSRGWGDCYGYALVATGRAEVMVDPQMNVWDCAALQPILEEAGGAFTDWTGTPTIHGGNAVASNGILHPRVLELLAEPRKPQS